MIQLMSIPVWRDARREETPQMLFNLTKLTIINQGPEIFSEYLS